MQGQWEPSRDLDQTGEPREGGVGALSERGLGRKQEKVRDSHVCAKRWEQRSELGVCSGGS